MAPIALAFAVIDLTRDDPPRLAANRDPELLRRAQRWLARVQLPHLTMLRFQPRHMLLVATFGVLLIAPTLVLLALLRTPR
jgi:hypothetical protein